MSTRVRTRRATRRAGRSAPRASAALQRTRSGRRLAVVLCVYGLITLALAWRVVDIQVLSASHYRELARRQTERSLALPAERGKLYDRTTQPLAVSLPAATVIANPRQLAEAEPPIDPGVVAAELARVLDVDAAELERELSRDKGFVYLARQQSQSVGERVLALEQPGVQVIDEPRRSYPAGPLAAQVVGFAGTDHRGLSGLERQYDTLLAGVHGHMIEQRAPQGLEISSAPRVGEPPVAGTDLVLTLDREIQAETERLLGRAVLRLDARGASAVVLDVASGEILAMAAMPGYRPSDIGGASSYERRNRVVTDAYEPGSVNKVITAAAALEEGVVDVGEEVEIGHSHRIGGKTFYDGAGLERGTLTDIIRDSSNVGTIRLAEQLGPERLHDWLRRFGYGRATALAFPGETDGLLAEPSAWSGTSLPTIAIGQGVSASLLQVAQVYATVARGGVHADPVLVRGSIGSDGRLEPAAPASTTRVVAPATARALTRMLEEVVRDGTGERAAVEGYRVAGKTGTAQKASRERAGYEPGAYVGTFVGFAPAERPEVVIAVAVDEAEKSYHGGTAAAPVFSELLTFTLGHRRVPPSDVGVVEPTSPQV